ncbi:hypothetical protein AAE478_007052 [Parahypoxylon ruwenzoriense]
MPMSFICHQCIARLAQSHIRRFRPKSSQLHTQAVSTSPAQPIWAVSTQDRLEEATRVKQDTTTTITTTDDHKTHWDGHVKKFVPRARIDVQRLAREPPPTTLCTLKSKIMRAVGNYKVVRSDLMYIYGLTYEQARHAVSQLERLLWGRHSPNEIGQRLDLFLFWKGEFKDLIVPKDPHDAAKEPADSPEVGMWTSLEKEDIETMKAAWHRLNQERREALWPQMILSAFRSNPGILPSFVQATFQPSWCPSYVVEDAVYLLFQTLDAIQATDKRRQEVAELVVFLLKTSPPRYLVLEQIAIRKVMALIPTSSLNGLHQTLKKVEHPLHTNTLLHLASRFARESKYKVLAAEIIYALSSTPGFDINSPAATSVCTSLLTIQKDGSLPQGHAEPDTLFKMLLEAGFRPNLLGLSTLMRNLCVRGHLEPAWKIFNILMQYNIDPDAHVFSVLLNGSKHNMDVESLENIVDMIEPSKAWTPVLLNDLLDFLYREIEYEGDRRRRQLQAKRAKTFRAMIQLYAKFFNLAPLQKLFIFPLEGLIVSDSMSPSKAAKAVAALQPRSDALPMQPDSITLGVMLMGHIRSINKPEILRLYYDHFLGLLHKNDQTILKVIKDNGTMIHDIFLHGFMQFWVAFDHAIQMVEKMIADAKWEKKMHGTNELHPPPSVYTYTILMNGFRKHKHPRGVVATLNMMVNDSGIKPNLATWNTVIATLLERTYLSDAVKVMRHMEQAGFEWNSRTLQAFSRLPRMERTRVADLLEKARNEPEDLSDHVFVTRLLRNSWARRLRPRDRGEGSYTPSSRRQSEDGDRSWLTVDTDSTTPL